GRQGALVARGLVAMNDVLVDQRVDDRLGVLEGGRGIGLVAGGDSVDDFPQRRAHACAERHVAIAVRFSSTGGFFSRLCIRHEGISTNGVVLRPRSVMTDLYLVNA